MDHRLGEQIAHARRRAGLTQQQLADAIDRTQASVADYEAGKHDPPIAVLREIATATGTKVSRLLGERLNAGDILGALAEEGSALVCGAKSNPGERLEGIVVGLLIRPSAEE